MHTRLVKSDLFSFRAVFGLILLTVLPGCSIPGMPDSELAERLEQNGYSFMPPAETGWFIADRSANRVAVAKVGKVEGQTYLIEGAHLALDGLAERSRLTDFVEKRDKRNLPPPRFRLRDYDVSELDIAGAQCALSRIVAEDREPETGTNVLTSMLVETIGTVCIHPSNSDLAITLTLSHRSFPEDQDRAFKAYAQNLLQTQQFSALTTRTPN
ncbi:MAG: hypothetical protein JSW48_11665 [Betaproteobacteria bacterium]|jgi:hypothetical protein|nr:MAG: hypothetical protein JSW48_11665 [Betaproteobacteria bacterium]